MKDVEGIARQEWAVAGRPKGMVQISRDQILEADA
jgi:hypothetical protein